MVDQKAVNEELLAAIQKITKTIGEMNRNIGKLVEWQGQVNDFNRGVLDLKGEHCELAERVKKLEDMIGGKK